MTSAALQCFIAHSRLADLDRRNSCHIGSWYEIHVLPLRLYKIKSVTQATLSPHDEPFGRISDGAYDKCNKLRLNELCKKKRTLSERTWPSFSSVTNVIFLDARLDGACTGQTRVRRRSSARSVFRVSRMNSWYKRHSIQTFPPLSFAAAPFVE